MADARQNRSAAKSSGIALAVPETERGMLLRMAREAIGAFLERGETLPRRAESQVLMQRRGTFVTLWRRRDDALRGCRGEPFAERPLIESVIRMAIAAATDDPRFSPVELGEVPDLRIGINALTPLALIRPESIEVGRHGLMIVRGRQAGLLLPGVAVRQGWSTEEFLSGLCEKAGLPDRAWSGAGVDLYGFETEVWSEGA